MLDVSVDVAPPLRIEAGDHIVLLLDGRVVANRAKAHIRLTDMDRGTRTLQAQVTTVGGALLLASPVTSFHTCGGRHALPSGVCNETIRRPVQVLVAGSDDACDAVACEVGWPGRAPGVFIKLALCVCSGGVTSRLICVGT